MSSIIQERGADYSNYMKGLLGQYNGNLGQLIFDCNKELFQSRKTPTKWFKPIVIKKIEVGKFYLVNYNFIDDNSGKVSNKLYAPIFTIDYRVSNNKHIIYAINLDYLSFSFKNVLFQMFRDNGKQIFEKNDAAESVSDEQKIPINFESMYNILKRNGSMNYAISAFDLNKINEVFVVSTSMMHVITNCHMRPVNVALMKELMSKYEKGDELHMSLEKLINELVAMTEEYDNDVVGYYKKLKSLESNYKLFDS